MSRCIARRFKSGSRPKRRPDMAEPKTICLTVFEDGTKVMALNNGPLLEGLLYAAHLLSGDQRLELIEQLQAVHAELEARFR